MCRVASARRGLRSALPPDKVRYVTTAHTAAQEITLNGPPDFYRTPKYGLTVFERHEGSPQQLHTPSCFHRASLMIQPPCPSIEHHSRPRRLVCRAHSQLRPAHSGIPTSQININATEPCPQPKIKTTRHRVVHAFYRMPRRINLQLPPSTCDVSQPCLHEAGSFQELGGQEASSVRSGRCAH